jgi:hypothetical protein
VNTFDIIDELDRDIAQGGNLCACTSCKAASALLAVLKATIQTETKLPRRLSKHPEAFEAYELAEGRLQTVAEKAWKKVSR